VKLTITTGVDPKDKGLIRSLRCLADLLENGCYPGEEIQMAEHIVAKCIKRFGMEPYDVKLKLKTVDGWGHKIK